MAGWIRMEPPIRSESVEALLFDIGGVVIDVDFQRCMASWARSANLAIDEIASRFSFDTAYEKHERGELPISGYLESLRQSLSLSLADDELLAGWNDIWVGVNAGILPVLAAAKEALPLYGFTNSNPTHHAVASARFAEPLGIFTSIYVSSEIGLRKPERAAFERVASMIGTATRNILFFDDSLENVLGARDAGMQAIHVTSTDSVRVALTRLGVAGID